jgi:SAM-dependent methyltransferase
LRSIPLRSNDFRIELELTMKLARRRARIFEVPIRYLPRTPEEGKKMSPVHGLLALLVLARFTVLDDMWQEDEYGSRMLAELQHARRFNRWLADTLRPFLGDRLLELGAGVAGLTSQFIPRELYVAADTNPHYLRYLHSYSLGKPYLRVVELDPRDPAGFASLQGAFDTVLWVSGLERVEDEARALANVGQALGPGGRAVLVVPQDPFLFNSLDQALEHRRRYTRQSLRDVLERAGLRLERLFDFNRSAVPAWILNGRLGRRRFSRVQLKTFEVLMPLIRQIDELWPWPGLSLVAVAVKETA